MHTASSTLSPHVLILSVVLIYLHFHITLNSTIALFALAILLLISVLQSLSQFSGLQRYTNSVTFSILLHPIIKALYMSLCLNNIVMVGFLNVSPASIQLTSSRFYISLSQSSSSRSILSASLRLLACTRGLIQLCHCLSATAERQLRPLHYQGKR